MRFLSSITHEKLIASLQAAHAAKLELWEYRLSQALTRIAELQKEKRELIEHGEQLIKIVGSQQETLKSAMQDLVILKGAGRIRRAEESSTTPIGVAPDVEVTDAPADLDDRKKLLQEAEQEYIRAIAGLDTARVSPQAIRAAMPASEEDWEREHAQPSGEPLSAVPAELS